MRDLAPTSFKSTIEEAERVARIAARMHRWSEMERAVGVLIECQQAIVTWWDEHVRSQGEARKKIQDSHFLSVADAERTIGFRQVQVSRFNTALKDISAYRARLIARVLREVSRPAPRPTPAWDNPDCRPTPSALIWPLVRMILPQLPPGAAIWDPGAGGRGLTDAMTDAGCTVFASDLHPQDGSKPRDFRTTPPPRSGMVVITHPPLSATDEFIDRGLSLLDQKAILSLVLLVRHDRVSRAEALNKATFELHCAPLRASGVKQSRWSWIVWAARPRHAPLYLSQAA